MKHFQNQTVVSTSVNRMDQFTFETQTSKKMVQIMLQMSDYTTPSSAPFTQPLSSDEIFGSLPVGHNVSKQVLVQYLTLLADHPLEFVGKSGDSGGGMYIINLHEALGLLAITTLQSVIKERLESCCAGIFCLVSQKQLYYAQNMASLIFTF